MTKAIAFALTLALSTPAFANLDGVPQDVKTQAIQCMKDASTVEKIKGCRQILINWMVRHGVGRIDASVEAIMFLSDY